MAYYLRLFLICLSAAFAGGAWSADLNIFAAASLKGALDEVAAAFPGDDTVRVSYGSSATMARQIMLGAPADIFISANELWMDDLESKGLLVPESRISLLGNSLVLVSAAEKGLVEDWASLPAQLGNSRIALAQVDAVPAGIYSKEALTTLGIWEAVAPQVVQADNVRAALAFAATGAVRYAVVYGSDAQADPRVQVLGTFAETTHQPIRYPAALIAGRQTSQAEAFLAFLKNSAAAAVFTTHGFTMLEASN